MSDSSSSSSSSSSSTSTTASHGLSNLLDQSTPVAPPNTQATAAPVPPTTSPAIAETATADVAAPIREDMIKPAVSFLSSPNVRSADRAKKVAFLQKKGLTQAEIAEAFKRAGVEDENTTVAANAVASATNNIPTTPPALAQQNLAPVLPSRNATYSAPQVVYYPQPANLPVPAEKVFAMAVVLGMGAVGLTAGVIGILRVSD
ncbi:peroxisomal membrane anchor protein conserved region-domain-containing protein [Parasitella parasitica]|nr:peroxisomal membrane anchor protein conserved region-domain-containing protein [Parasitella parasitica]